MPEQPTINAAIVRDGLKLSGTLAVGNQAYDVAGKDQKTLYTGIITRAMEIAKQRESSVTVRIEDHPQNIVELVSVSSDGEVKREETSQLSEVPTDAVIEAVPGTDVPEKPVQKQAEEVQTPKPERPSIQTTATAPEVGNSDATESKDGPALENETTVPTTRRSIREAGSFLAAPVAAEPATQGFRGWLNTMGFSLTPSEDEVSEREDIRLVSKHYAGTRTIAVVNQKGGSNKTPTVATLAAVFGRYGASALAWDNNPTTGTLGWRTQQGDHERTALDVISSSTALLSPTAQSADINAFVHHQNTDKYDVLRSDRDIKGGHQISSEEVDVLHEVAAKYYRMILMDSGNNHGSAEWNRMVDYADQLVVPTTNEEDRVEAALLTLQGLDLKGEHSAQLAADAVVIVSERQRGEAALSKQTAEKFRPYVKDVVIVPFDDALKSGKILFGALEKSTQRAWLRAAAAVARGL